MAAANTKFSIPRASAAARGCRRNSRSFRSATRLRSIRFAEVVVLLMDTTMPFEEQDLRLADLVIREGRALVIGMNKRDLADLKLTMGKTMREEADHWLPQAKGMPIVAVSGMHGDGLDRLMKAVVETYEVWNKRVSTSQMNRFLERALAKNPPPAVSGARIKLRYMTQSKARPPSFVLFGTTDGRLAGILYALSDP